MWVEFPIQLGHAPDLPRTDPKSWLISGAYPLNDGVGTQFGNAVASSATAFSGTINGGAELFKVDGTRRIFYGTTQRIYEWDGETTSPTVTDRSQATYNGSGFHFASFGDIMLAADKSKTLQQISTGAAFADIATAPKADIVVTVGPPSSPFVMVFNYNDGVNNYLDGWFGSGISNHTDWSANVATQSANGRLLEPTGPITAAIPFRDGVLAFKNNAMYFGEYVGPDIIWLWRRLSGSIGCVGKHAICAVEDKIYWADRRGFYFFDGSYPQKIPGFVHETWAATYRTSINPVGGPDYSDYVRASYDPQASVVMFDYSTDTGLGLAQERGYYVNTISGYWTARNLSTMSTSTAPVFMLTTDYGVTGSTAGHKPTKTATTTPQRCFLTTPIIGNPQGGNFLKGFWPSWSYPATGYGPQASDANWLAAAADESYFAAQDMPQKSGPDTTETAIRETNGRATATVQGMWVYAHQRFLLSAPKWQFSTVYLDVEVKGKR